MPVPWETLMPMGLVVVLFGVTGTGFNVAKRLTNDGKVGWVSRAPPLLMKTPASARAGWGKERHRE